MNEYIVTVTVIHQLNSECMFPYGSKLCTEMEEWGKTCHTQGVIHMLSFKQQQVRQAKVIYNSWFVLEQEQKELMEDATGQSSLSAWGGED